MRVTWIATAAAATLLFAALSTHAQDAREDTPPSYIAVVDGSVSVTRDGEREAAAEGIPLIPGDVVRTDRGRIDVVFPDGSALDLDEFSTFELLAPTLFRLTEGRLRMTVAGTGNVLPAGRRWTIDTPLASADLLSPGEYRLSLQAIPSGSEAAFDVVRGRGVLSNEQGTRELRAGETSIARDAVPPSGTRSVNSARFDAFDRWASSMRDQRVGTRSGQYLPSDLRMYGGVLDRHGLWEYESDYGYVWYPQVAADWRPYDDGYWSAMPAYGWTWIGVGAWSWPTHHYGRWGNVRNRWFWIPERHWAPAWVSWGAAPGYVSWCPLGYDNRPVFGLSISTGDRWDRGWTVLRRDQFGRRGINVRQYAERSLPPRTPFIVQSSAPLPPARGSRDRRSVGSTPGYGAANGSAGIGVAVPRNQPLSGFSGRQGKPEPRDARPGERDVRPPDAATPPARVVPSDAERRVAPRGRPRAEGRDIYGSAPPPAAAAPAGGVSSSPQPGDDNWRERAGRYNVVRRSAPEPTTPNPPTAVSPGRPRTDRMPMTAAPPPDAAPAARGRERREERPSPQDRAERPERPSESRAAPRGDRGSNEGASRDRGANDSHAGQDRGQSGGSGTAHGQGRRR